LAWVNEGIVKEKALKREVVNSNNLPSLTDRKVLSHKIKDNFKETFAGLLIVIFSGLGGIVYILYPTTILIVDFEGIIPFTFFKKYRIKILWSHIDHYDLVFRITGKTTEEYLGIYLKTDKKINYPKNLIQQILSVMNPQK
jgi:hypothetical protein